jgi:CxxC motif-containing protein
LQVDEQNGYAVTGNGCKRGAAYGPQELQHPVRIVTSTVRILGAEHPSLPVKTAGEVPKGKMFDIVAALSDACVTSPIHMGDVVLANVCDTGVDVVASRSM